MKDNPALLANGNRTIYGYFDKGDIPHLAEAYPLIGGDAIARIADAINAPRLLEVTTILEVVHRYLEKSFSQIRGLSIKAVSNPLSVLFWNEKEGRVQRIKTRESELMHGACEKLALRTDGVAKVNQNPCGIVRSAACYSVAPVARSSSTQRMPRHFFPPIIIGTGKRTDVSSTQMCSASRAICSKLIRWLTCRRAFSMHLPTSMKRRLRATFVSRE